MRTRQGDAVMNQLVCFVANQWKKHYDRPAERVVCRLTDTLFAIGCADKNCAELAEELNGIYAEMPRACVASVGLMRRVPLPSPSAAPAPARCGAKTGTHCISCVSSA